MFMADIPVMPGATETFSVVSELSPIIVTVMLVMIFNVGFQRALLVAIVIIFVRYQVSLETILDHVLMGSNRKILLTILAMMFLRTAINECVLPQGFNLQELQDFYLLLGGLPFLIAFASGSAMTGVATGAPLFLSTISNVPNLGVRHAVLLVVSTFCGYLLSPIHLCFVLTKEYFEAQFWRSYQIMLLPILMALLTGIVVVLL